MVSHNHSRNFFFFELTKQNNSLIFIQIINDELNIWVMYIKFNEEILSQNEISSNISNMSIKNSPNVKLIVLHKDQ